MARTRRDDPDAVDAYLAGLPEQQGATLERVRALIRTLVPGVVERVAYAIPIFADETGDLIGLSAHRDHLSIQIMSRQAAADLADRLAPFRIHGAQALHFTPEHPVPEDLVSVILATRHAENVARRGRG